MPNFISVIVLCGIVRVLLSVTGPVNGLLHTSINFMTLPEAIPPHLHYQRHLAGCRLGIHHVHRIPF